MNTDKNLFLLRVLKESFGENLTTPVIKSSISFCNFWEEFEEMIANNKIRINPDLKRLAQSRGIDLYKKIRIFSFLNILFLLSAFIMFFFNWKLSLIFFFLMIINYFYVRSEKKKAIQKEIDHFNHNLMNKNDDTERFIEIIKYYCTGGIQLISEKESAFLPTLPETCITGIRTFPHQKYDEELKILMNMK